MTLSKIQSVQPTGSFENKFGALQNNPELPNHGKLLLYKFEYAFEDGTVMMANHKTITPPFSPGTEVEYEVTKDDAQYGKSGKVKKPEQAQYSAPRGGGNDDARQLMIVRQSSLHRATELLCHNSAIGAKPNQVDPIDVVELANRYAKWVMGTEKKAPTPQPEVVQQAVEQVAENLTNNLPAEEPNDDLPF